MAKRTMGVMRGGRWLALVLVLAGAHAAAAPQGVVISQVYGGGGNSGATWKQDFIELHNAGSATVSLVGWSVQYASSGGSSWQVTSLSGSIAPGQYHLVRQAQGTGGTQDLPAADSTGTIPMSGTAGKVALVASTTALTVASPSGGALQDLVGWGSANGYEGGAAAPATINTTSIVRAAQGCTDTDSNSADFAATTAITPRNSAAPAVSCGGVPPIVASCPVASVAQGSAGSAAVSASDADSIVNQLGFAGMAPAGFSIRGFAPAAADGGSARAAIDVDASVASGRYALVLEWRNDDAQSAQCTLEINVVGLTPIHAIQGWANTSPLLGQPVTTRGVVTFKTNNGFFMQDPVGDGDPATSDGIFVFGSAAASAVAVGQLVEITATVAEFNVGSADNAATAAQPLTELVSPGAPTLLGSGYVIAPVEVVLDGSSASDLERVEGMLVRVAGPLSVSQNFFLGRYGQLTLSTLGRLQTPTNLHRPGPLAQAMAQANAWRSVLLDDGSSLQNPNPTPYIGAGNTVRAGDTLATLTGVVDYGLATSDSGGAGAWRIQPTEAPVITRAHARSALPPSPGGNLRVASFNVLNYFTTLNDGANTCPPSNTADDCRGANSVAEFTRQRDKIVAALAAIDADVVGLVEMQNNGAAAVQNLVDGLNAVVGTGTYARVPDAATTGTDAIKVAMIHKPARLVLDGTAQADTDPIHNRPPLAQTFRAPNGERFTLVVNHFKSKGSCPASGMDADQGDLQGCWNARRVQQAQALRAFVDGQVARNGVADVLVVGDLNAYAQEDPVAELVDNGYVDLIGRFIPFGEFGYSYVFDGAAGRLDHALATAGLAAKATGALEWHINADEPSFLDYNLEFKRPACATCAPDLYSATPYRASDHDPVLVGIDLYRRVQGSDGRDTLVGSDGDDLIVGGAGADLLSGGGGADRFAYASLRDAGDTVTDFVPGTDRVDLRALLASLGWTGLDPVAEGWLRLVDSRAGLVLQIDPDGAGPALPRPLVTLHGASAARFAAARDLMY